MNYNRVCFFTHFCSTLGVSDCFETPKKSFFFLEGGRFLLFDVSKVLNGKRSSDDSVSNIQIKE